MTEREEWLSTINNVIKDNGGFLRLKDAVYPNGEKKADPFRLNGMYVQEMLENGNIFYYYDGFKQDKIDKLPNELIYCIFAAIKEGKYSAFSLTKLIKKIKEEAGHIKLVKKLCFDNREFDVIEVTENNIRMKYASEYTTNSYKYSNVSENFLEAIYNSIMEGNFI